MNELNRNRSLVQRKIIEMERTAEGEDVLLDGHPERFLLGDQLAVNHREDLHLNQI